MRTSRIVGSICLLGALRTALGISAYERISADNVVEDDRTASTNRRALPFLWPRVKHTSESMYELINTKPGTSQLQNGEGPAIFLATRAAAIEFS